MHFFFRIFKLHMRTDIRRNGKSHRDPPDAEAVLTSSLPGPLAM
jgi:hypothetical protein